MGRFNETCSSHKRFIVHIALAAALLVGPLWAAPARAQQTGTIKGTAEDVNGAPVKGIKVTLHGKSLIGGAQERLTDINGEFRFVSLPPGSYSIKGQAKGFRTATEDKIVVGLGGTKDVTLLMEAETVTETVTVTAKAKVVDTEKVTTGGNVAGAALEDLPLMARDYQGTAQLLPGVTGDTGNPTIHGGTQYSNQYLIDGVNTTDPTTNTFSLNFNYDAIEEVQIITGGFSPEYGNVSGGVVNVVTKSGSNEFHLDSSLYYDSDSLMMEGPDESPRDFRNTSFNVNFGGPILKDKLWYFGSLEYNDSMSQLPATSPVPDLDGKSHPTRRFHSLYWLTKLTYAPTAHNRFMLMAQGDPATIDNADQLPNEEAKAETHQDQGGILVSTRWDGMFDPWVFKVQGAYKRSFLDIFPQERADSSSPFSFPGVFGFGSLSDKNRFGEVKGCLIVDPTKGCTADAQASSGFGEGFHYDLDTGAYRGGTSTDYYILRTRYQLTATASYFLNNVLGDHEFKVGTDIAYMTDEETHRYPGGASLFLDFDQNGDGIPDPYYARIVSSDDNELTTKNDGHSFAYFLLDNWKLWHHVFMQPGVRIEQSTYNNYKGEPVLDFTTISPRMGLAVDLTGDGNTRLHANFGQLYETGNLELSKFVGKSLETRRAYWDPTAGPKDANGNPTGAYVENPNKVSIQGGESGTAIDPNVEPMRTDEYQLGIERALGDTFSVDLTYIHRDTYHAWEDFERNLIWNQAGTDVIGSRDGTGQQTFVLKSMDDSKRTYDALEASAHKAFSGGWTFDVNYTLAWYRGTTPEMLTSAFDNYRQNTYLLGYLADDQRHTIKADLVYDFDFGLQLGLTYLYQTGSPFNKLFYNDYDGDYTNRQAPRGTNPGDDLNDPKDDRQLRLPDLTRINLRAVYDFKKLTGLDLQAIAEIHNLLNSGTVTGYWQSATAEWLQPTDYQQPFSTRLGLRFKY